MIRRLVALPLLTSVVLTAPAPAEPDIGWSSAFGLPGFDSEVEALMVHQGLLIAGGSFRHLDSEPLNKLAAWDGVEWTALGGGLPTIYDKAWVFFPWQGDLLVGGSFVMGTSGGAARGIARWDGTGFRKMGSGLNGAVTTIANWNGTLVASGSFWYAGDGRVLKFIATWGGGQWQPFPVLLSDGVYPGSMHVHAGELFVLVDDHPQRYLARWSGTGWEPIADVTPRAIPRGSVQFASDGSNLIMAGSFQTVGGVAISNFGMWDGNTWQELGGGLNGPVFQLQKLSDGSFLLGGAFTEAGSVPVRNVVRWDGTDWDLLGGGVQSRVYASTEDGGDLFAGGIFQEAGGDHRARRIARWDGTNWEPILVRGLGVEGRIDAFVTMGIDLVAGGAFPRAGGVAARNVARFDGTAWSAFGNGLEGDVLALEIHDGQLIAGGTFAIPSSGPVIAREAHDGQRISGERLALPNGGEPHRVAVWNGTAWSSMDEGLDGVVRALESFAGELYAGGDFGGHVARWTGAQWSTVDLGTDGPVLALAGWNDRLVAAGNFSTAGAAPAMNVAGWNDGWSGIGGGTDGAVRAVTVHGSDLVLGGDFDEAGTVSTPRVARWDGEIWSGLSEGLTPSWAEGGYGYLASVSAVESLDDDLVVGGFHIGAPSAPTYGVVRWRDGDGWSSLEGGINGTASALHAHQGTMYVGGPFSAAQGGDVLSRGIAAWRQPGSAVGADTGVATGTPSSLFAFPNPFGRTTRIGFALDRDARASLTIHDVGGRLVARLIDSRLGPGRHTLVWSGRDERGAGVPAGVYFVRLQREDGIETRKILRLR